jgi:hypothetical protein
MGDEPRQSEVIKQNRDGVERSKSCRNDIVRGRSAGSQGGWWGLRRTNVKVRTIHLETDGWGRRSIGRRSRSYSGSSLNLVGPTRRSPFLALHPRTVRSRVRGGSTPLVMASRHRETRRHALPGWAWDGLGRALARMSRLERRGIRLLGDLRSCGDSNHSARG